MLHNRPKIGAPNIDWRQHALGVGKNRRKTIGLGPYVSRARRHLFEVYIRELSIIDAGLGCALWDASIILSRWLMERGEHHVVGRRVLELGSGCGLPGFVCARFASEVLLTDYIAQVLDNLRYNLTVNATAEDDPDLLSALDPNQQEEYRTVMDRWRDTLQQHTQVLCLDWEAPPALGSVPGIEAPFDILIGSELTYSLLNVTDLANVIEWFMDRNGVFIEILSRDRDGVSKFVEMMAERGFEHAQMGVDERFLGDLKTGQRREEYDLHAWYYPTRTPVFEW